MMSDQEQSECLSEDIRKLRYSDRHENEARTILKPHWFVSKFARDMAIIDLSWKLRERDR